jgi:hypothetical protein
MLSLAPWNDDVFHFDNSVKDNFANTEIQGKPTGRECSTLICYSHAYNRHFLTEWPSVLMLDGLLSGC